MRNVITILLLLISANSFAQIIISASVNRNSLTTDQRVQYIITVENSNSNITPPDFKNFSIVSGPMVSSQQQVTYINGSYKSVSKKSYTYVLQPKKAGTFTIGSASISSGGKKYSTEELTITVTKGTGNNNLTFSNTDNIMIRVTLNHSKVYQSEEITATYYLYAKYPNYMNLQITDMNLPTQDGFWSQSFDTKNIQWENNYKTINGAKYAYAVILQEVLIPLHSGTLELTPFTMSVVVNQSIFSRGTQLTVKSNKTKLQVKPLPKPVPNDFIGAVGDFTMDIKVDSSHYKTNDPITVHVNIKGNGNLKLIDNIMMKFPNDFEQYDPKVTENIKVTVAGTSGNKAFDFLTIPRHEGDYSVGPLSYSYFDPNSATYKKLYEGTLTFTITKGGNQENESSYSMVNKEDVEILNSDIHYINTNILSVSSPEELFIGTKIYYCGLLFPAVGFLLLFFVHRKRIEDRKDIVRFKSKKASSFAVKKLSKAKIALGNNDNNAFYDEIAGALYGYLGDKLNVPVSQRNKDVLSERLEQKNMPIEKIAAFTKIVEHCEMARFSPSNIESDTRLYQDGLTLIKVMEKLL